MRKAIGVVVGFGLIAVAVACSGDTQPGAEEAGSPTAALLDGEVITVADLDDRIKNELFDRATDERSANKLYQVRRDTLERLIDERLLDRKAEARGVSREALLSEAAEQLVVSDDEVQAFYEKHKANLGDTDFESLKPRIVNHLKSVQGAEATREFLASLREGADLEVRLAPPRTKVAAEGPGRGPENAPVTIVEFSDYQCPFCRRAEPIIQRVLELYPDQVRFVYRHFPLDSIHPLARGAAEAAACAEEQNKFWEFHEQLFSQGARLEPEALEAHAEQAGLDVADFRVCVEENRYRDRVEKDVEAGRAAGVKGTPAFFVNGIGISGAQPVEEFVKLIDGELAAGRS